LYTPASRARTALLAYHVQQDATLSQGPPRDENCM